MVMTTDINTRVKVMQCNQTHVVYYYIVSLSMNLEICINKRRVYSVYLGLVKQRKNIEDVQVIIKNNKDCL